MKKSELRKLIRQCILQQQNKVSKQDVKQGIIYFLEKIIERGEYQDILEYISQYLEDEDDRYVGQVDVDNVNIQGHIKNVFQNIIQYLKGI